LFDAILTDAGITVVRSGIRVPRMNAITERWVRTCRRELLDRILIYDQRHLLHALREYEAFYNRHRPHQGIANARPLRPLPESITAALTARYSSERALGARLSLIECPMSNPPETIELAHCRYDVWFPEQSL